MIPESISKRQQHSWKKRSTNNRNELGEEVDSRSIGIKNPNAIHLNEVSSKSVKIGVCVSKPKGLRRGSSSEVVVYSEPPPQTESKSLFKPKPRTPSDIVRNTRDLLRLLQNSNSSDNKRDNDKVQFQSLYLISISSLLMFLILFLFNASAITTRWSNCLRIWGRWKRFCMEIVKLNQFLKLVRSWLKSSLTKTLWDYLFSVFQNWIWR